MPKIQENIAVNNNAGAFTSFVATMCARQVTIEEDPNSATPGQGLQYQLASESFLITHKAGAGEQIVLGNSVAAGNNAGPIQGTGPQANGVAASVYAKVRSNSGTATAVRMTEVE